MTDVQNTPNAPTQSPELEQSIAQLKKQADRLGISYKSNVSYATLQKAVSDVLNAPSQGDSNEGLGEDQPYSVPKAKGDPAEAAYDKAMKLIRVIITPMEATKAANLESEVFTAGNATVGSVKRLIQFGEPWHVEQILLNSIKEKKYQLFTSKKDARGVVTTKARLVNAYNVAILDPLTPEEMAELADRQIRTRALLDDE